MVLEYIYTYIQLLLIQLNRTSLQSGLQHFLARDPCTVHCLMVINFGDIKAEPRLVPFLRYTSPLSLLLSGHK